MGVLGSDKGDLIRDTMLRLQTVKSFLVVPKPTSEIANQLYFSHTEKLSI